MVKVIKISEELRDYIESLDYERTARRDLITFMLSNNMNTNTDSFKNYQKEYSEYNAQFDMAKKELEIKYVPAELRKEGTSWSLDYQSCEITITTKE